MSATDNLNALEKLFEAGHPCVFIPTCEEAYIRDLVITLSLSFNRCVMSWSATRGLGEETSVGTTPVPDTENAAAAMYYLEQRLVRPSFVIMHDLVDHLDDATTKRALRELIESFRINRNHLILIDHRDRLPDVVSNEVTVFEPALPDHDELEKLLRDTLKRVSERNLIAAKISKRDLRTIVRNLSGLTRRQAEQIVADCATDDYRFDADDINTVLARKRHRLKYDGVLEYVETPIELDAIGGLTHLKKWLEHRQRALDEDAVEFGLQPPRGVLLLGVQGAGKSLSAKAIAAAWKRPLLRLDPGRLYDRYVGESESRLRKALRQAEMMAPIVLWIDEIEKGFASAAAHSTDGGLSQRMFGTLLTWMQDHREPVFLVATANNISALPPELLRKGRFDEIFFVDLPGRAARKQIARIHLTSRDRDPESFDIDRITDASEGYSGAEIEQAVISAMHRAFTEKALLNTDHIEDALRESPPLSVTMAEQLARLRAWAADRCVPAG